MRLYLDYPSMYRYIEMVTIFQIRESPKPCDPHGKESEPSADNIDGIKSHVSLSASSYCLGGF